jgi:hypothetical protein
MKYTALQLTKDWFRSRSSVIENITSSHKKFTAKLSKDTFQPAVRIWQKPTVNFAWTIEFAVFFLSL